MARRTASWTLRCRPNCWATNRLKSWPSSGRIREACRAGSSARGGASSPIPSLAQGLPHVLLYFQCPFPSPRHQSMQQTAVLPPMLLSKRLPRHGEWSRAADAGDSSVPDDHGGELQLAVISYRTVDLEHQGDIHFAVHCEGMIGVLSELQVQYRQVAWHEQLTRCLREALLLGGQCDSRHRQRPADQKYPSRDGASAALHDAPPSCVDLMVMEIRAPREHRWQATRSSVSRWLRTPERSGRPEPAIRRAALAPEDGGTPTNDSHGRQ